MSQTPQAQTPQAQTPQAQTDRPATVLITGGGAGIGAETARRFTARGWTAVILESDPGHALAIAEELSTARVFTVDVSDPHAVDGVFEQLRADGVEIDVLVNNVASNWPDSLLRTDPKRLEHDLLVTLGVPIRMTQRVLPGMIERGQGVILSVTSVNGLTALGNEAYSAAKAGLISFTKSVAMRYGPDGIRANAVAPGTIATQAWSQRVAIQPEILANLSSWYPMGRVGEPGDVAEALVFLASPAAAWISGVCLPVDGGLTAGNLKMARELLVDQDR